jgi:predicted transcriptional regulator of viral defense system
MHNYVHYYPPRIMQTNKKAAVGRMSLARQHARKIFQHHATMRTREILAAGIHPRTLYQMRDAGELEQQGRGLFRLADLPPVSQPDLVTIAKRIPNAVLCLVSALAFHELTTQVPHQIELALPITARNPRLTHPPIQVYRFSKESFRSGIETHLIDGVSVRVYSPEKSLADVFKYRNKIGTDIPIEALRAYLKRPRPHLKELMAYARACRVEKIIRPYLDAIV